MNLGRIEIRNLRNLQSVSLQLAPGINLFHGDNGSGKSSLLEAIWMLGLGRSFRTNRIHAVINHEADSCEVFGEVVHEAGRVVPVGICRARNGTREIRIAGQAVDQLAELTRELPLQLINTDSIQLLSGPPDLRRRYLNWGVFHVERDFHGVWRSFQNCLRQRNALLRSGRIDRAQIQVWSGELATAGEQIDRYRRDYIDRLDPLFMEILGALFPAENIELAYQRGWDPDTGLADLLRDEIERDVDRGYTQYGPQRADLQVRLAGRPAGDVLSRGELKLVASGLMCAQVILLRRLVERRGIFLIDDLASELDQGHRERLCRVIEEEGGQVLVTSVEPSMLEGCWGSDSAEMFHVEHGQIRPER